VKGSGSTPPQAKNEEREKVKYTKEKAHTSVVLLLKRRTKKKA